MKVSYSRSGTIVRRFATGMVAVVALASLGGCDRQPEGQVLAVVNGDEITTEEVNGELPGSVDQGDAGQPIRNAALQRVVDRLVLADVAREQGIDSSPEYVLREKKLRETLLVQMLNEKIAREIKDPSSQDIDRMIADNPQAFADRTVFALDQLVFQMPKRPGILESLKPTKSMDEVVAVLNRSGIRFQRGNTTVDSATLTPAMFAQFRKIGSSEPMIIPVGQSVSVAKIVASRPVPVTGDSARPLAGTGYKREATQKRLRGLLETARQDAKITYQSGYGPPDGLENSIASGVSAPPTSAIADGVGTPAAATPANR